MMGKYTNPLKPTGKKTATYNYTEAQLKVELNKAVKEGISVGTYITNSMYSAAMLMVLHDTLGYGVKRLDRIFQRVQKLFGELCDKDIQYSDLVQTLKDECGVNLVIQKPDGVKQDALDLFNELETVSKLQMITGRK